MRLRRWHVVCLATAVVAAAVAVYFINAYWPFRYRVVKPLMENVLASQVTISHYHRTYFPQPGFVATGLTLHRKTASAAVPPIGSAETLVVQGRWSDLFSLRDRVDSVDITSLHVVLPPPGSRAMQEDFPSGSASDFAGPDTLIDHLKIHKAVLDVMRPDGNRYSFPIAEIAVDGFQKGKANTYAVDMKNAKPRGRIQAHGNFGPLNAQDLASTPVSGVFTFTSVDLPDIGKIGGTLSSSGHFAGSLGAAETSATSQTPDFEVDGGKPTRVSAEIQCKVDGITGDVLIHSVALTTGTTTIYASGSVQGSPKVTNLDFEVQNGHTQDALRPFMEGPVPVAGTVRLRGHAYLAPAAPGVGFLQRLKMDGIFAAPAERFTDSATEKKLTEFSQRAQVKKPDKSTADPPSNPDADALSSLEGPVSVRNGVAASRDLKFLVAGAQAHLQGSFNLNNRDVHLTGDMAMQTDISHATTGFKSFLLKPLAPFLRKKNAGAVVPIAIIGGPGHYKVTSDFFHDK
jgi:AsmA-like C-terminal region